MELLVFFFFLICTILVYQRNREISLVCFLFFVYAVSAFSSILIKSSGNTFASINYETNYLNVLIFCALIYSCISPYKNVRIEYIKPLSPKQQRIFDGYCYLAMISFIVQIVHLGSSIVNVLSGDLGSVRRDFYRGMLDAADSSQSLLMYIPNIVTANYSVTLLFFFFSITILKKPKWFNIALFISSTGNIITDMMQASRTTSVFWLLICLAIYFLFYRLMPSKSQKRARISLLIGGGLILMYLIAVTTSRFGDNTENSIIKYMGEPFISFSNIWNNYVNKEVYFGRLFPLSAKYIFHNNINIHVYRDIVSIAGVEVNQFITHYGDAIVDLGRFGMIVYAIIIYIMQRKFIPIKNNYTISDFIILILLVRIPLHGMFAYVYGSITLMLSVIFSLFLVLFIKKQ